MNGGNEHLSQVFDREPGTHGQQDLWGPKNRFQKTLTLRKMQESSGSCVYFWIWINVNDQTSHINYLCTNVIEYYKSEIWQVQNENTSIQYPVQISNTEVSVSVLNLKNTA